jgi:hypothetical protein
MQLELFPTAVQSRDRPSVLLRLSPEQHAALVRTLARVLAQALRPPAKGASHER